MFTIFLLSAIPVMILKLLAEIQSAPAGYEDENGFHLVKRPVSRMPLRRHDCRSRTERGCLHGRSIDHRRAARASVINRIHGHRGVSPFFELRPPLWSLHTQKIPLRIAARA